LCPVGWGGRGGLGGVVEEVGLAARVDVAVDCRGLDAPVANRADHHGKKGKPSTGRAKGCVQADGYKVNGGSCFRQKCGSKVNKCSGALSSGEALIDLVTRLSCPTPVEWRPSDPPPRFGRDGLGLAWGKLCPCLPDETEETPRIKLTYLKVAICIVQDASVCLSLYVCASKEAKLLEVEYMIQFGIVVSLSVVLYCP